jgi:hypothetical protein
MKAEQGDHGRTSGTSLASTLTAAEETAATPGHALEADEPVTASSPPEPVESFSPPPLDSWDTEAGHDFELESQGEPATSTAPSGVVRAVERATESETKVEEHAYSVPEDARSHSMSMSSNDLSHELVALTDVFTDLSERLVEAAGQLQTPGLPPPDALVAELSSCRREFANLRDRTLTLGQSLQVACPPVECLTNLEDLTTLLDAIAETELRQSRGEEMRRRGLSVLERVLGLRHAADDGYAPLHVCQETARALHGAIASGSWNELPAEVETLAEGEHAMAHLVTLVEDADELSDDLWAQLHESVGAAFGKPLATAAARARLVTPLEHVGAGSEQQ